MIQHEKVTGEFELNDKTTVVTGGAGGIGETTARTYVSKGVKLISADMKDTMSEIVVRIAEKYHTQAIGIQCDLTEPEEVDRMIETAIEASGEVNMLTNVAGQADLDNAEDTDSVLVENQMNVNTLSVFHLTQKVGKIMIKRGEGGKIVCVTSQVDFITVDKHVGYTMSKVASIGMIKVMALEWAEFGINVNGTAPTVVRTYMGDRARQRGVKGDTIKAAPAHRFAEVDEIAAVALSLSCNEPGMVTGEDLVVDGRFTIR